MPYFTLTSSSWTATQLPCINCMYGSTSQNLIIMSLPGSTMSKAHKQLPIFPFKIIILLWQLSLWVFTATGYPSVPLFTHYVCLHQSTPFKICKILIKLDKFNLNFSSFDWKVCMRNLWHCPFKDVSETLKK